MDNKLIEKIIYESLNKYPDSIERFKTGLANYVYKVTVDKENFVVRISGNDSELNSTYWIEMLSHLQIRIPKIKFKGEIENKKYLVMSYIHGDDLGNVYHTLNDVDKKNIAKEIIEIQNKVSKLPMAKGFGCVASYDDKSFQKSWIDVILSDLDRSRRWMEDKYIFDISKIDKVKTLLRSYNDYLTKIKPVPFLDDITTKNVLINEKQLSGIIDLDWLCFGDFLYFIALTNMSLLNMGVDTKYIDYLIYGFKLDDFQIEIIKLYTLVFCVIFMSEIGMKFNKDEPIEVDYIKVERLNFHFDELYNFLSSVTRT